MKKTGEMPQPQTTEGSPNFKSLFGAVVKLVEENPPSDYDPGHGDTYTRVFLPTADSDHVTSAFIGYETEPQPIIVKGPDGRTKELQEIGHVNIESVWGSRHIKTANYRHILTAEGVVVRQVFSESSNVSELPVASSGEISDDTISALVKRLAA
jgi:hypothetical protein